MSITLAYIIGTVLAVVGTAVVCVTLLPEGRKDKLSPRMRRVHEIINFKRLSLDKFFKVLYILGTLICVGIGIMMLFSGYRDYWDGSFHSHALKGVLLIVLGPPVMRLGFEILMLFVNMGKDIATIRRHLDK